MPLKRQSKATTGIKRKPYKKRGVKLALKQTIKSLLLKNQETKQVMYTLQPTYFNSGINSTGELYQLLPPVAQNVSQTGRIGESIMPQKIVVRGYINYGSNSYQGANEIISRLFCFQDKSVRSWDLRTNISLGILDTGGSGSQFTGTLINVVTPHNNDHFTFFKDAKHKFLKPYGYTNNTGVTTAITSMNSSLVWFFTVTLTKKQLPAVLKYDGSDYPVNFCPVMGLGYSYALNDSPDTLTTQLLMAYTSTLYYKDA